MEKVKRRRRHPIRNLPLRWSFMLYVLLCAISAAILSITVGAWFSNLQSDLYRKAEQEALAERGLAARDALPAETVEDDDGILRIQYSYVNVQLTGKDAERYNFYSFMSFTGAGLMILLCVLLAGFAFYSRKLKAPLQLFDRASARIAAGDLDFQIAYDNRNEMGRLATSFETMRAALEKNQQEMWRQMESRKRLNAAFAHDLRTPLTVLKGYCEYLRAYIPERRIPEEKLLSTIDLMHAYIARLEGYAASMSAMQRLEALEPSPEVIAFEALCRRLEGAADMLKGTSRLGFACAGEGDLVVDPDLVVQVLENLVANAARYAAARIDVAIDCEGAALRMTVSDDGPGFSAAMLAKGISPYAHGEDGRPDDHFGLGLFICSVLCQRHGGTIALPERAGESRIVATFGQLSLDGPL